MRAIQRCGILIAISLLATASFAESGPTAEELRVLYEKATQSAEAGNLYAAQKLFSEIWQYQKTCDVALHLAEIEAVLGHHAAAAEYARTALASPPSPRGPQDRERAETLLAQERAQVGVVRLTVPNGAEASLDGSPLSGRALDEVFVDPGAHRFEASKGGRFAAREVVVKKGETTTITLSFVLDAAASRETSNSSATVPADDHTAVLETRRGKPRLVPVIIGSAVTAAGLTSGIVLTIRANQKADDADAASKELGDGFDACGTGTPTPSRCGALRDLREDHDQARNVATWSFAVGGASAAATVIYALWPRRRSETTVRAAPTGSGLMLMGRF